MSDEKEASFINTIKKYPSIFRALFVRRWTITKSKKILGVTLWKTKTTYEQDRILMIIPIGEKIIISEETEYLILDNSAEKLLDKIIDIIQSVPLPVWLHNQTRKLTFKSK